MVIFKSSGCFFFLVGVVSGLHVLAMMTWQSHGYSHVDDDVVQQRISLILTPPASNDLQKTF